MTSATRLAVSYIAAGAGDSTWEAAAGVGLLRLQRGDNRNSMTPELLDAFGVAVDQALRDNNANAIVITGEGTSFCAGADFRSIVARQDHPLATPAQRSYAMYKQFLRVLDIAVPVIGALNGHAVGGGFGLSLCCDIRIGSSQARYGANFAKLGLAPGMAITYLLPRLVGEAAAARLLYSGELLDAKSAKAIGYLNEAVDPHDVLTTARQLACDIAANAPLAVRASKQLLCGDRASKARAQAQLEAHLQAHTLTTNDASEGIAALLAKRPPQFSGR